MPPILFHCYRSVIGAVLVQGFDPDTKRSRIRLLPGIEPGIEIKAQVVKFERSDPEESEKF
jgi:hypothetical protein